MRALIVYPFGLDRGIELDPVEGEPIDLSRPGTLRPCR